MSLCRIIYTPTDLTDWTDYLYSHRFNRLDGFFVSFGSFVNLKYRVNTLFLQKNAVIICTIQKKAVTLQAFSSEMARRSALTSRPEAARISSSPQKSADFRGPRKRKTIIEKLNIK